MLLTRQYFCFELGRRFIDFVVLTVDPIWTGTVIEFGFTAPSEEDFTLIEAGWGVSPDAIRKSFEQMFPAQQLSMSFTRLPAITRNEFINDWLSYAGETRNQFVEELLKQCESASIPKSEAKNVFKKPVFKDEAGETILLNEMKRAAEILFDKARDLDLTEEELDFDDIEFRRILLSSDSALKVRDVVRNCYFATYDMAKKLGYEDCFQMGCALRSYELADQIRVGSLLPSVDDGNPEISFSELETVSRFAEDIVQRHGLQDRIAVPVPLMRFHILDLDQSFQRLLREPIFYPSKGCFDLSWDRNAKKIRRKGISSIVDLSTNSSLFPVFEMLAKSDGDVAADAIENVYDSRSKNYEVNIPKVVSKLRNRLKPLNIGISYRKYRLLPQVAEKKSTNAKKSGKAKTTSTKRKTSPKSLKKRAGRKEG